MLKWYGLVSLGRRFCLLSGRLLWLIWRRVVVDRGRYYGCTCMSPAFAFLAFALALTFTSGLGNGGIKFRAGIDVSVLLAPHGMPSQSP